MSESYEQMSVIELRKIAKEMGVKLGAGINKQGIIDKLNEAGAAAAPPAAPVPAETPARHIRSAAIITDDEIEEDEDDIPVLTPNQMASHTVRRPVTSAPAPTSGASSLSTISAKAPAFTMEGSRAWHNPRAYQGQPAGHSQPSTWTRPADPRGYSRAAAPSRTDSRATSPRPAQPVSYPNRFGPDQPAPEAEPRPNDYRAPAYGQPQQEYQPRQESAPGGGAYGHRDSGSGAMGLADLLAQGECGDGEGVLEVHPDGYGFLRVNRHLPGKNDVYISNAQIRRFSLRSGDYIVGKTRPQREMDRYCAMLYITDINGHPAEENQTRPRFEDLTPLYPVKRITLNGKKDADQLLRTVDLLSPVGFGQRGLIAATPDVDRIGFLKKIAAAMAKNQPKAHLMLLLADQRPEDISEIKEDLPAELVYSTFDESSENQARICDLALERALRLVEQKRDVIILADSLNRIARAGMAAPAPGRFPAPGTLFARGRHLFGAARNTKEAGSLTVLATVEMGQDRPDDILYREFQKYANLEWYLEKNGAGEGADLFSIDFSRSRTLHCERLLTEQEMEDAKTLRAALLPEDKE